MQSKLPHSEVGEVLRGNRKRGNRLRGSERFEGISERVSERLTSRDVREDPLVKENRSQNASLRGLPAPSQRPSRSQRDENQKRVTILLWSVIRRAH